MAQKTATKKRRPRSQSRTKQVVKMIKRSPDIDTLGVVKMFIPESKFNHLSAEAKSEIIKLGAGMIDVVRAGEFDLRTSM